MSMLPLLLCSALAAPQSEDTRSPWEAFADGETIRVEQVYFVLNEEMITLSMVEETAARLLLDPDPRAPKTPDAAMSQALVDLVFDLVALEGFRRLGMDENLLEQEVTLRMDRLIEADGSRARFEEGLRAGGFTMVSFRDWLKGRFVQSIWRGVVTGQQPSPLEGYRSRLEPTPSDLRAEFDADPRRWEQGFEVVWLALQYHDNATGPGFARAQTVADALAAGTMTVEQARQTAQSAVQHRGDPSTRGLLPAIRDFLLAGQPGAVSAVEPIPNLGGMLFVVTERSAARTIGFEEAQFAIAAELRKRRSEALVANAAEALLRSSYTWYPPELENFMRSFYGEEQPARETEF
jgi:hypothetical protein